MVNPEFVRVILDVKDRLTGPMRRAGKSVRQFNQNMFMSKKAFSQNLDKSDQFTQSFLASNTALGKFGGKLRLATRGTRDFRMEMLGLLFFGMAIQRMFTSMLRPAFETLAIFELWTELLRIVFLPVAQAILPIFLDMFKFFVDLPPNVKLVIGVLAILGAVFGFLMFLVATVVLGFGSLAVSIGVGFGAIVAFALGIILVIVGVGLVVTGFVKVFRGDMKGVAYILIGIGLILLAFIGWWALIPIAVGIAILAITKNWTKFKSFFSDLWMNMKLVFAKALRFIFEKLQKFYDFLGKLPGVVGAPFRRASDIIGKVLENINDDIERAEAFKTFLSMEAPGAPLVESEAASTTFNPLDAINFVPKEEKEVNITNNITTTLESKMDFEKLADEVTQRIEEDLRRGGIGT